MSPRRARDSALPVPFLKWVGGKGQLLPALLARLRHFFHGPSTSNPKLVNYLAAGGVQGLRPLRKEKRVARNRFILFAALLFVVLFGTLWWFLRNR